MPDDANSWVGLSCASGGLGSVPSDPRLQPTSALACRNTAENPEFHTAVLTRRSEPGFRQARTDRTRRGTCCEGAAKEGAWVVQRSLRTGASKTPRDPPVEDRAIAECIRGWRVHK